MLLADEMNGAVIAPVDDLQFRYLPGYARFLLDNKLTEFAAYLLRTSREMQVPLLRYFASYSEEQLIAIGEESNTRLLSAIAADASKAYLAESLRSWKENQLPLIQGDSIVIEDLTKVSFTRRKAFRNFLPEYAKDFTVFAAVMEEVDRFILAQEEDSYKTLFALKEAKIREHHHFIDKINNASPGIVYVLDIVRGRQIYTNHKREELLGYTDEDMLAMANDPKATIMHPDDRPGFLQHLRDFSDAAEGEMRTTEYRVRDKGGKYSWQRAYETVFKRDEAGTPVEVIGIAIDVSEEKEASKRLEQREQQLREAQEIAGMGSFEWNLTAADQSSFSPQLLKIFELEERSNLQDFLAFVHPADRAALNDAIQFAVTGGGLYECEYRYRKHGPEKVIWSRGKVLWEGDRAVKMRGTVMDVTLRHDMLKRLERSEQLHKQAQALTHIGNWSWTLTGNTVEWSDEMYRIFGLPTQSQMMTLDRILPLLHPGDREDRRIALQQAMTGGGTEDYTMRVLQPDGTVRYVDGKTEVLVDEQQKPYKIAGTCQDVTKQYLLNEQLKENEEVSRQLINNAPEAIVVIDESSRILLWNPKAEQVFGWTLAEVRGKTLMQTIIPEAYKEAHQEGIIRLQSTGVSRVLNKTIEITALRKDGTEFYISLTISQSVRDGSTVYIAFIRDITLERETAIKLVEQRNQLAQKNRELLRSNEELTAFNYIASHDLQEPVRKIKVFTNLITAKSSAALPEHIRGAMERIDAAAGHMQRLIDALIAFSRTDTGERAFERIDLNDVVAEVAGLLREKIGEAGAVLSSSELPSLNVIPFQIQQLFENIIGNALKYRRPDAAPQIVIGAEEVDGAEIEDPGAERGRAYWKLSISDNGIGFEQQYAGKVFELFQRLHNKDEYSGTGIGLAICKKIVQNHRGFIAARSTVGQGTTFEVYLPAG